MDHFQQGITNRPPDHALLLALQLNTTDPARSAEAVERLREVVHRERRSDLNETTPTSPKEQPSAETGELGFDDHYERYHLTATVGFAASAYDKLGVAPEERPQDLRSIDWAALGDNPRKPDNGDIVVQVCTDSVYIAEHFQRRIEEELGDVVSVAWVVAGSQRHNSRSGRAGREEGRALIGFKDGTSNLNPRHNPDDAKLVFVNPADIGDYPPTVPIVGPGAANPYGGGPQPPNFPPDLHAPPTREPDWAEDGSYMVVRASVIDTATWDKRSLGEQEHTVGRFKVSGQALDKPDDASQSPTDPDYAADPNGATTPVTAHIRKANPRGPDDAKRELFRRGYPLVLAEVEATQCGLVFVSFARTVTTQFEFITRAWTNNPDFPFPGAGIDTLRAFETVLCGGYFFVPPLARPSQPWSWVVPLEGVPATA